MKKYLRYDVFNINWEICRDKICKWFGDYLQVIDLIDFWTALGYVIKVIVLIILSIRAYNLISGNIDLEK